MFCGYGLKFSSPLRGTNSKTAKQSLGRCGPLEVSKPLFINPNLGTTSTDSRHTYGTGPATVLLSSPATPLLI